MFTSGQITFAFAFALLFIALMVWSYRKDIQVNRIHFAKSYKILLGLLGFVLLLYLVVKLRKYL